MSQYRKIFLVADPSMCRTPAFDRAVALAQTTGAALHMCLFDYSAAIAAVGWVDRKGMERARDEYMLQRGAWLGAEASALSGRGIKVTWDVAWARPMYEEVLAQVRELSPDLVIKDAHHESALRRVLLTPQDWQLLRLCPAPLLLVHSASRLVPKRIIAAVDPAHDATEQPDFNDQIIRAALALALQCDAEAHIVHVFDSVSASLAVMPGPAPVFPLEAYESLRDSRQQAFNALAAVHGVPADRRHFLDGVTASAIAEFAQAHATDVVVLGTVHRTGVERLLMGSTAEQILERVPCNVLAVKPEKFGGAVTGDTR
jgi:universal stress protein E